MAIVAAGIICMVKCLCRVFIGLSEAFVPFIIYLAMKVEVESEISLVLHNVM